VHTDNPQTAVQQAHAVLRRFVNPDAFRVVMVDGDVDESAASIRMALAELGIATAG